MTAALIVPISREDRRKYLPYLLRYQTHTTQAVLTKLDVKIISGNYMHCPAEHASSPTQFSVIHTGEAGSEELVVSNFVYTTKNEKKNLIFHLQVPSFEQL